MARRSHGWHRRLKKLVIHRAARDGVREEEGEPQLRLNCDKTHNSASKVARNRWDFKRKANPRRILMDTAGRVKGLILIELLAG